MIKEIRQINYAAEEIIFKDKLEKALIVHKPLFDGQTLEEFIPLQEKDDFTYGAVFEDTAVDIEFDSPAITQDKAGKRYSQKKAEEWIAGKLNMAFHFQLKTLLFVSV